MDADSSTDLAELQSEEGTTFRGQLTAKAALIG